MIIAFRTHNGKLVHSVAKSDHPYFYSPKKTRLIAHCGVSCSSATALYDGKNSIDVITCPKCRKAAEKQEETK